MNEHWFENRLRRVDEILDAKRHPTGIEKHFTEPPAEQPCKGCGCPTINGSQLCHSCVTMVDVVLTRRWFIDAHAEWTREQERKRAMITGDNYFPGWSD
jgi:hypothetical protein